MSRPKGSGAIKFLRPREQDTVEMRNRLFSGESAPSEAEETLKRLFKKESELRVQLANLQTRETHLRAVIDAEGGVTLKRAKAERELHSIEAKIKRIEQALTDMAVQIEEAKEEIITNEIPSAGTFEWQTKAVSLIELHKYVHKEKPGSVGADTVGSTITTRELQKKLRAEGFEVGARELRRFMRVCGVAGQQGKRTDL
jgi:predicted RNase H-like nuclease (RuvC/YqgF family)